MNLANVLSRKSWNHSYLQLALEDKVKKNKIQKKPIKIQSATQIKTPTMQKMYVVHAIMDFSKHD